MPATSCAASFTLFMTVVEMLWIWSGFLVVKRVYNHQSAKEHYYSNMIMMMTIILIVHKSKKLKIRRIQLLTETSVLYQWYYLNTSTTATTKYIYTYIYIIANPPNDIIETTYYTIIQDTYNINYSIFINTWTNLWKWIHLKPPPLVKSGLSSSSYFMMFPFHHQCYVSTFPLVLVKDTSPFKRIM